MVAVVTACFALPSTGCSRSDGDSSGRPKAISFPVETLPVTARKVEFSIYAVGSVDAFERVEVSAKVEGVVEKVRFMEGHQVKPGDILVEVEPERFRLSAAAARAEYEKAEAGRRDAETALARREELKKSAPDIISEEDLDSLRREAQSKGAESLAAKANYELAELKYRDAFVRAPAGGTIETRTVQTGQYVKFGTVLATLIRRDPLLLRFQVPEQEAANLSTGMAVRFRIRGSELEFPAEIIHVAARAEELNRMVPVTARITAPDTQLLRPGQFAEVTAPVSSRNDAAVIPQSAIRPTSRGFLAFVVEDAVARERILTLGLRTEDGWVEVRTGIRPGEIIVTRGAEALHDGAEVTITGDVQAPQTH